MSQAVSLYKFRQLLHVVDEACHYISDKQFREDISEWILSFEIPEEQIEWIRILTDIKDGDIIDFYIVYTKTKHELVWKELLNKYFNNLCKYNESLIKEDEKYNRIKLYKQKMKM